MTADDAPYRRGHLTLRLDAINAMWKALGTIDHEATIGLSLREARLLLIVRQEPDLTISQLVERSFLEKTIVSRAVTRLCQMKLLRRSVGSADARHLHVALTRKGAAVAERADDIATSGIERTMSVLTPQERKVFETALEKIGAVLAGNLRAARAAPDAERAAAPPVESPTRKVVR